MSKPSIEQVKLLEERKLILHTDRVEMRVADRKVENTSFFRYEDIGNDKRFRRVKSQPNYSMYVITRNVAIVLFFCRLFGAIEEWSWALAFFVSSIVFFVIHAYTYKSLITLEVDGEDELELYKDEPSAEEVKTFLDELYTHRNAYLREHYFTPCDASTEQGKALLKWLLDLNAITKPEYAKKIAAGQQTDSRLN